MKTLIGVALALAALCLGCASGSQGGAAGGSSKKVEVIRAEQIGNRQYEIIETLEDNEMITTGASRGSAEASLTARLVKQAGGIGADAIIIRCSSSQGSLFCRGLAIRWLARAEPAAEE
jgi:hypothetical protein